MISWAKRVLWVGSFSMLLSCGGPPEHGDPTTDPDAAVSAMPDGAVADAREPRPPTGWLWDFEHGAVGEAVPTGPDAIVDASGALHARADEGLTFVPGHVAGQVAVRFAGDGAAIARRGADVARVADLDADDSFYVELGFRTDAHGRGTGSLFGRDGGWALEVVRGQLALRVTTDAGESAEVRADALVSDGIWHRAIAARGANGELSLMLDGALVARAMGPTGALSGADTVRVGGAFVGEIDRARFVRERIPPFPSTTLDMHRTTVFVRDTHAVPGRDGVRYHTMRIPAIVRLPDGTLLAFAEGRIANACDVTEMDVVLARSTDEGRTWSAPERVTAGEGDRISNPVPVVDTTTGRVVLISARATLDCDGSGGCPCSVRSVALQVQWSDDGGHTWTAPTSLGPEAPDPTWRRFLMGPSHGIQLQRGPNAGALVVVGSHETADGKSGGHLLISHDGGESWTVGASEHQSGPDVVVGESTCVELADGSLYVNTRRGVPNDLTLEERALGLRAEARLDSTLTYTAAPAYRRTPVFRGPAVHGSLTRWAGTTRFGDHARVFFSYPAGEHGVVFSDYRHDLRLYASDDETESFRPGVRVIGERAAYSDLVALPSGRLGVLFETARRGEGAYHRVDFASMPIQRLDDPTVLSWTFERGVPGEALSATRSGGLHALELQPEGGVILVEGRHPHTTAARFEGGRACVQETALRRLADIGIRDGFEVEVVFRTSAHGSGGAGGGGALMVKTVVGTEPAWWLRVEDGRVRFFVVDSEGMSATVLTEAGVSDGSWHHVRAGRDVEGERIYVSVDGVELDAPLPTRGYIRNDSPLCLGAFGDGERAFQGDIDAARLRLTN